MPDSVTTITLGDDQPGSQRPLARYAIYSSLGTRHSVARPQRRFHANNAAA